MPTIVPGPTTIFDDPSTRGNGPVYAGSGATKWRNKFFDGQSSGMVVDDHLFKVISNDQGAYTLDSFTDSGFKITFQNTTGGAFGWYWHVQEDERFVWLVAEGLTWKIRKRTIGGSNAGDVDLDAVTLDSSLSQGLIVRAYQGLYEVYRIENNTIEQEPVLSAFDEDFTEGPCVVNLPRADAGEDNPGWRVSLFEQFDPSLEEPPGPLDLLVFADHENASDAYTRDQVDDDHPLATPDRAAMLAFAWPGDGIDPETKWGDKIKVKWSLNANPDDERGETSVYAPLDHRLLTRGARPAGYPFGDNSDGGTITIEGIVEGGIRPAIRGFTSRRLANWASENIQWGYHRGGGNDYLTLNAVERAKDLFYLNCDWTGGANQYSLWEGTIRHELCRASGPLSPGANDPFDGRAFGTGPDPNDSDGGQHSGVIEWVQSQFDNVRGNDAIQASVGAYTPAPQWGRVFIDRCLFWDIIEGASQFHTDSIQVLGGPLFEIQRSILIGVSTALIASDFRNGKIRFDVNLVVGGGGLLTIQGTDNLLVRNNTVLSYGPNSNTALFLVDRTIGVTTKGDIRNNILQSIYLRDRQMASWFTSDTVISHNLVIQDPGGTHHFGQHLPGIPELGLSDRINALGLPDSYIMDVLADPLVKAFELATVPSASPGIGQGVVIDDPDFPDTDLLGRAWTNPPDIGCLQSDPGTEVQPSARPPYVISRTPASGAADVDPDVTPAIVVYPKPGETMSEVNAVLIDPEGVEIPAVVNVPDPDEDGRITITIDPKYELSPLREGQLLPSVVYTVHVAGEDTEGSVLASIAWSFRIRGLDGPAITPVSGPPIDQPTLLRMDPNVTLVELDAALSDTALDPQATAAAIDPVGAATKVDPATTGNQIDPTETTIPLDPQATEVKLDG